MSQQPHPLDQPSTAPPGGTWHRPDPGWPAPGGWQQPAPAADARGRLSWWLLVGLLAAVAAIVVVIRVRFEETHNGIVTECSDVNYGPYVFAPIVVLAGVIALVRRRHRGREQTQLVLGLLCVAVGAGQLLAAVADVNLTLHDEQCEVGQPSDDPIDPFPSALPLQATTAGTGTDVP